MLGIRSVTSTFIPAYYSEETFYAMPCSGLSYKLYMGYGSFGVGSERWWSSMGGGHGQAYTFDSTDFGAELSMTDYSTHHHHVADEQGASNIHLWLNHNIQVVDLIDSQFQV